jgi:hypothetical protein
MLNLNIRVPNQLIPQDRSPLHESISCSLSQGILFFIETEICCRVYKRSIRVPVLVTYIDSVDTNSLYTHFA